MMAQKKGEALMLLGALLLFVGPALDFITVKGPGGSESLTGYDAEEGSTYVLAGVVVGAMAIGLWFAGGKGARTSMAALGALGGAFGAFGGFVDITEAEDAVPEALRSSVEASAGIGTWIVLVGAVIALIGALLSFKGGATEVEPPPPPPVTAP